MSKRVMSNAEYRARMKLATEPPTEDEKVGGVSAWREAYQRHLQSDEWQELRQAVIERCDGICERCLVNPMQDTHHLTYKNMGHENLSDLAGLCHDCHSYIHGHSDYDPMLHCERCGMVMNNMELWRNQMLCGKCGLELRQLFFMKKGRIPPLPKWFLDELVA